MTESLSIMRWSNLECTRHLLAAGAKISGTILYRALDLDNVDVLRLLLSFGADPNEPPPGPPTANWGSPLLWAIRRRRSPAQIAALLVRGADPPQGRRMAASAHTLAQRFALPEVAGMLGQCRRQHRTGSPQRNGSLPPAPGRTRQRPGVCKSERPDLPGSAQRSPTANPCRNSPPKAATPP